MVANLTHGNKNYEAAWEMMENVGVSAQELRKQLLQAIDQDTDAFNKLMDAFRLPKKTEEDQRKREEAIEEATKEATRVPFGVMEKALQAMKLCKSVADAGNENAVSDAGVGALAGNTAVYGAYLNVKINLPGIKDEAFKDDIMHKAEVLLTEANILRREILDIVESKLEK